MGTQYRRMTDADRIFIADQKVFFVASCSNAEVNLSPKGYDTLRVIDDETVVYLDYPGSGDRTARDIGADGAVTIMFTAFTGKPLILRLFVKGELIEKGTPAFDELLPRFAPVEAASVRRLILYRVYAVERSCGMGTPLMTYQEERNALRDWAVKKGADGSIASYIADHATPPDLTKLSP